MRNSAGRRVLMLLENHPYPQDSRVRNEAQALTESGYQVTLIAPRARGQRWCEDVARVRVCRFPAPQSAGAPLAYLWEYGCSMVGIFLWSLWVFARRGFDVVHAHNPPDTLVLIGLFYKIFGKRFVFDHHDLWPEMYFARFGKSNPLLHRAMTFFERLSCRWADHIIATNESYKKMEMKRSQIPDDRITVVRNGPEPSRVREVPPDPALRQTGKFIIGYVGVIGFHDGLDYLLRALSHLRRDLERDGFLALVIGRGDAVPSLKELAHELGLDQHVRFTGRVSDEDLMRYLSSADICVDPDPWNPFSDRSTMIKVAEYMALGKPVVAFDLREHRVTAEGAALYAKPNDEADFAAKIASLMDDPDRRLRMGLLGKTRVRTTLAWEHQAGRLLAAYGSL